MAAAAEGVETYWAGQLDLMRSLPAAVLAREPDAVHDLRAAGRRLRSTIRVFGPLLRRAPAGRLAGELSWYNDILGAARDAEVMAGQLGGMLGAEAPGLITDLERRREELTCRADEMLASRRAGGLLEAVGEFVASAWRSSVDRGGKGPKRTLLVGRLDHAEARVAAAWRTVAGRPDDLPAAEHRLRRRAKTARYTLEALDGTVPHSSRRAERYAALTSRLGIMQDAAVIADALGGDPSGHAEALISEQRGRAEAARLGLPEAVRAALPGGLG